MEKENHMKYLPKKIRNYLEIEDTNFLHPHFKINNKDANLEWAVPRDARHFDDVKTYIENLAKTAEELMRKGYEIEYCDEYGCGKITKVNRNEERMSGFNLSHLYLGNRTDSFHQDMQSVIESSLKYLSNEPQEHFANRVLLDTDSHLKLSEIEERCLEI
ncbi:MAG: hypothetical protein ABIE36_01915 [Candidatus Diapherotrites archaeon]